MVRRCIYVIELDFDQADEIEVDHEGIQRCIVGTLTHLNTRGVLSSLSAAPCPVHIASVRALLKKPAPTLSISRRADAAEQQVR